MGLTLNLSGNKTKTKTKDKTKTKTKDKTKTKTKDKTKDKTRTKEGIRLQVNQRFACRLGSWWKSVGRLGR